MPSFQEGDRVRIVTREVTDDDVKSQMYYAHYAGWTGTVQKVYSKQEVAVDVDTEALSKEVRQRHDEIRSQMKTKWLDGLSEEGRSRLTERERDFRLRYITLVAMSDLEKAGPRAAPAEPRTAPAARHSPPPSAPAGAAQPSEAPDEPLPRRTLAEIEAAEEAEFQRRARGTD